ncbi:tail fiber domain-containing protein [Spirochaetota bacterium]
MSGTPVKIKYKKDNPLMLPAHEEYTGFIAQEVQETIPEAVVEKLWIFLHVSVLYF